MNPRSTTIKKSLKLMDTYLNDMVQIMIFISTLLLKALFQSSDMISMIMI